MHSLFIVSAGFINRLTLYLSPVALLVIIGYSLTKRFTALCHFVLGLGLSLAPIGAYISVTGKFSLLPVIYSFIVLTWVSGFDIIYALQDDEFDKSNKLSFHSFSNRKKKSSFNFSFCSCSNIYLCNCQPEYYGQGGYLFWTGAMIFHFFINLSA